MSAWYGAETRDPFNPTPIRDHLRLGWQIGRALLTRSWQSSSYLHPTPSPSSSNHSGSGARITEFRAQFLLSIYGSLACSAAVSCVHADTVTRSAFMQKSASACVWNLACRQKVEGSCRLFCHTGYNQRWFIPRGLYSLRTETWIAGSYFNHNLQVTQHRKQHQELTNKFERYNYCTC